jgi:hypothetical protein
MFTHEGILQRLWEQKKVNLRQAGKLWIDEHGRRFLRENGKRPLDSSNGIRLLIETIKEKA